MAFDSHLAKMTVNGKLRIALYLLHFLKCNIFFRLRILDMQTKCVILVGEKTENFLGESCCWREYSFQNCGEQLILFMLLYVIYR